MVKRGLSSEDARKVRQKGHDDALEFAKLIGLEEDYTNNSQAKKDVVDPSGDTHSVKSGAKKWQIFLYRQNRFLDDPGFLAMNGIGQLLSECINTFPPMFDEYQLNKAMVKERLKPYMRELSDKFQNRDRVKAFISKSMFNGGEVNYLTVKEYGIFHVFSGKDVVSTFGANLIVSNSKARSDSQVDDQKVLFKYDGINLAELEMRNDSKIHYREIRFNMIKPRAMALLFDKIELKDKYNDSVFVYGEAGSRFGRWRKT